MQNGMEMDYDELCQTAAAIVSASDFTQTEVAEALSVTTGAMSRALSESGPKFSSLQCRIIEYLTPCDVKQKITFVAICSEGR